MKFEQILPLLKKGKKAHRLGWNGKGSFIAYQKGYPLGVPCNKQTAELWGLKEGDLFKLEPYLQMKTPSGRYVMYSPNVLEIFSEDWEVVE